MGFSFRQLARNVLSLGTETPIAGILDSFKINKQGFKKEPNTAQVLAAQKGIYYICSSAIEKKVGKIMRTLEIGIRKDGKFIGAKEDHIFYDLRRRPNPIMSGMLLDMLLIRHLIYVGKAFCLVVPRLVAGRLVPHWLWPLDPKRMTVAYDGERDMVIFKYDTNDGKSHIINPQFVMWPRYPNAINFFDGYGAGQAVALEYDTDKSIWEYESHMFESGLFIRWILKYPKEYQMTTDEALIIAKKYGERAGDKESTKEPIVAANGVEVDSANLGNDTLEPTGLTDALEMRQRQAFGVPKGVTGGSGDAISRANLDGSMIIMAENAVEPALFVLLDEYKRIVVPMYNNPGQTVDFRHENPVPRDKTYDLEKVKMELENGVTVVNEIREKEGREPVPWGNTPLLPFTKVPLSLEPPKGKQDPERKDSIRINRLTAKEMRQKRSEMFIARQEPFELRALDIIRSQLKFQQETIVDRIEAAVPRALEQAVAYDKQRMQKEFNTEPSYNAKTKSWTRTFFRKIIDDLTDMEEFKDPWIRNLSPLVFEMYQESGIDAAQEVGASFVVNDKGREFIGNKLSESTDEVLQTNSDAIRATLTEGFLAGEGADALAMRVRDTYEGISKGRALTIARTETVYPANYGARDGYQQAGVKKLEWIATLDAATRADHADADGEQTNINGTFSVGGEDLPFPGGGSLPGNNINCRCTVGPVVDVDFDPFEGLGGN